MAKSKRKLSTFERLTSGKLNRKQRKDLARKLYSENPGLEIVHPNAAGIDVGNESHFVAVPPDRDPEPVREFGCWTADVVRMAEWLQSCRITTVVMQATGIYGIPLQEILERHGLEVYVVNARHTKNLPGRKTDVQECQWLMKLHTYGLLRNSFRPPEQIQAVKTLWRLRDRHVKDLGRCIQHMQKALTIMNVQLANVISDVSGTTGQAIVRSILAGERDPYALAAWRDPRCQASEEEIARSLEGNWREDVLFELQQAVDSYDFYQKQLDDCDQRLQQYLAALPTRTIPAASHAAKKEVKEGQETGKPKKKQRKKPTRNAPKFDLTAELKRICGVDLTSIDGIDVMTVQTVVSEVGTDLSPFPDENHFVSWTTLSPKRSISGGKLIRHEREPAKNRVACALRISATTLLHSNSNLGARYRNLRARLGAGKAVKAMACHLARLVYRLLTNGEEWVDHGQELFEKKREEREMLSLKRKAAMLGYQLVLQPTIP